MLTRPAPVPRAPLRLRWTLHREGKEPPGSVCRDLSLNQALLCRNATTNTDSHHLQLRSWKLFSLSGPPFPYLQMGVTVFVGRITHIIDTLLRGLPGTSKGSLRISYITIITTVTINIIHIIFLTTWEVAINTHLHLLPKGPQGDKSLAQSH